MTRGRTEGREKGKKENIRALTKTVALEGGNGERGQQEFIRGQRQDIYTGGGHPADSVGSGTNHIPTAPGV